MHITGDPRTRADGASDAAEQPASARGTQMPPSPLGKDLRSPRPVAGWSGDAQLDAAEFPATPASDADSAACVSLGCLTRGTCSDAFL